MNLEKMSDTELIEYGKKQDFSKVYPLLYNRYKDYLTNFLCSYVSNKEDRKEVVQDALIKIFLNLGNYHNQNTEGNQPRFKNWIFTITRNTAFDYLRKQKSEISFDKSKNHNDLSLEQNTYPAQDEESNRERFYKIIDFAIEKLPDSQRKLLKLKFRKGYEDKELNKIIDKHPITIRVNYCRGKKTLRKIISREFGQNFVINNLYGI